MNAFKIWKSEIEGRLDVGYYIALKEHKSSSLFKTKYPIKKMSELSVLITKGESPLWQGEHFLSDGIPFLRGKNIKDGMINFEDITYISKTFHEKIRRSALNEDLLLLTIAGTLGEVAFFKKEYPESNINQDIAKIKLTKELKYEYAVAYFQTSYAKSQIGLLSNGGTRSHLNFDQIKSFKIIVPPLLIQNEIVSIMDTAYQKKREKEMEAEQILDSIDNYLISMLGLKIPDIKNKMCFAVMSGEVVNGRLDAEYYNTNYENFIKCFKMSNYECHFLHEFLLKITSGQRPKGGVGNIKEGIPSIGGEHILNDGYISSNNMRFIPKDFHEKHLDSALKINDILIIKDGATTGKVGILQEDYPFSEININEHVFLLRCKKSVNPYFIFCVLKSPIGQIQIKRSITGATVTGIIRKSIMDIKIPLPPLEIQNQIALEVQNRIEQAKRLNEEAKTIFELAKSKINSLLIGDKHEL